MDFFERLKKYVEGLDTFTNTVDVSLLMADESICLRLTPSGAPKMYLDEKGLYTFNFQILVRQADQIMAYQTKQFIALTLMKARKGAITSSNNSFKFVKCSIVSMPSFLEKDSKGWLYTTLFSAEIYIN